jgi:hypothetical protein
MDIAIELAKCKEAAVKVLRAYPHLIECVTTALLEARADALRTLNADGGGELLEDYPGLTEEIEGMEWEVRNRRLRGL